jgi:nitrate/TMAO reductase-like tetraheme cytochrome c subunit
MPLPESSEKSPAPLRRGFFAWLWRRPKRLFLFGVPAGGLLALIVGAAAWASFTGGMKYAETDQFCTSCHEMRQPYQELTSSPHFSNEFGIQASCGNCHVPPTFFAGLSRHIQAYAEVWGHMQGELNTPAKYEAHRAQLAQKIWTELKANDSAECRSCHTPSQMAFAKQTADAASAHQSLKQDGSTCIDCHQGVAHRLPQGG